MVAIREIIEGAHEPYGLYHATTRTIDELRQRGLRASSRESIVLHMLIRRLTERLSTELKALGHKYPCETSDSDYPLELSLSEQLALAPVHYSAVPLVLEASDARWLAGSVSEPERKARALVEVARRYAPHVLEGLMRSDGVETDAALNRLDLVDACPYVLLKLTRVPAPDDGFFSLLAEPQFEVNGLFRSYNRPELRPEARAVWFNGIIPFECFEVVSDIPAELSC